MENMHESSPDVKSFNLNPSNTSNPVLVPDEGLKFDKDALYYDMSGEKYLIILNQHTFKKTVYFKNQQPVTRDGTDNDVKSLKKVFGNLGFKDDNIIVFRDKERKCIIKNLNEIADKDHSKTSCVCVVILTHGDNGGVIYAADRPYVLADVIKIFEKPNLVNKPKLFFVQACRGCFVDAGHTVQIDGDGDSDSVLTVPTHADFLVLCSTVEDHLSYRDMLGSWMIQALCHIIQNHHEQLDLVQMIALVNRLVAYEKRTYIPYNKAMDKMKQMPETRFTLTKLLKF